MSDTAMTDLLGITGADDDATDQDSTADGDEGGFDPIAVLDALDVPEDEFDDEDETEEGEEADEEEVDYKALYEQRQADLAQREEAIQVQKDETDRQEQLRLMRQAEQAWKAEEAQAVEWARRHPKHDEAIAGLVNYYNAKLQAVTQSAQVVIQQAYSGQYIDQVAGQAGLSAEDKALLAAVDPKQAPALAKALATKNKQTNDKMAELEAKVNNLSRGRGASRRALTGQDRPSSSRNGGAPPQKIKYGSTENAMFLLDATAALAKARRGER